MAALPSKRQGRERLRCKSKGGADAPLLRLVNMKRDDQVDAWRGNWGIVNRRRRIDIGLPVIVGRLIPVPLIVIAMPVTVVSAVTPAIAPVALVVTVLISQGRCHCHGTGRQGEGECQQWLADHRLALPSVCFRDFHCDLPFCAYVKPLPAAHQFLLLPACWCPWPWRNVSSASFFCATDSSS